MVVVVVVVRIVVVIVGVVAGALSACWFSEVPHPAATNSSVDIASNVFMSLCPFLLQSVAAN